MAKEEKRVTRKQFLRNMELKVKEQEFLGDIEGLLRPEIEFNQEEAYNIVKEKILENI